MSKLTDEELANVYAAYPELQRMRAEVDEVLGLTKKQTSRALASLAGKTATEIAAAEGVSKQAISKTLGAKRVKVALSDWIAAGYEAQYGTDGVETGRKSIVEIALETILDLMSAKKAVVYGGEMAMVPDNAIRLAAASRLLEIYEPTPPIATSRPAPPSVEESVEEVQERETTRRRVSRRRAPDEK